MPTNVGQEITPPLTDAQASAIRLQQSSQRIYNWVLQAWESSMNELWDHWTDEDRTERDASAVEDRLTELGNKGAATFSDSSALTTMLMSVGPEGVINVFDRLKLWDSDNNVPVVPTTIDGGTGIVSYVQANDLAKPAE